MEQENYFHRFPSFQVNASAPATSEFDRLARHMKWSARSTTYRKEKARFAAWEFSRHFGAQSRLQNWQALCLELRLDGPMASITQCRKALAGVHVNLWDLIDARRAGTVVYQFPTLKALRNYTRDHDRYFPKKAAKDDGFLRDLLRRIW